MHEPPRDVSLEEDHADESDEPEFDEALDPELGETQFVVEVDLELEQHDVHDVDQDLGIYEGARDVIEPRSVRTVEGMGGKVFDFRETGLCPPNGGRIRPLVMVHHIPVVENAVGLADFQKLANILKGAGRGIQAATDAEGNVALFTRWDELCFGQLGANSLACGVEHMHLKVREKWTEKQMRAAAWCSWRVWKSFNIPAAARNSASRRRTLCG